MIRGVGLLFIGVPLHPDIAVVLRVPHVLAGLLNMVGNHLLLPDTSAPVLAGMLLDVGAIAALILVAIGVKVLSPHPLGDMPVLL